MCNWLFHYILGRAGHSECSIISTPHWAHMRSSSLSQVVHFVINNAAIAKEYGKKYPLCNELFCQKQRQEKKISSVAKLMVYQQSPQSKDSYAICFAVVALNFAFLNQMFQGFQNRIKRLQCIFRKKSCRLSWFLFCKLNFTLKGLVTVNRIFYIQLGIPSSGGALSNNLPS